MKNFWYWFDSISKYMHHIFLCNFIIIKSNLQFLCKICIIFSLISFIFLFGRFLNKEDSFIFTIIQLFFSLFVSFLMLLCNILFDTRIYLNYGQMNLGLLKVEWFFFFDSLNLIMINIVLFISVLVHIFSYDYMHNDPCFIRFLSYLTLFTFFMILLLSAGNFLILFLG